jgi:hypothetical protein
MLDLLLLFHLNLKRHGNTSSIVITNQHQCSAAPNAKEKPTSQMWLLLVGSLLNRIPSPIPLAPYRHIFDALWSAVSLALQGLEDRFPDVTLIFQQHTQIGVD